jgi:hypothetical protein
MVRRPRFLQLAGHQDEVARLWKKKALTRSAPR